MNLLEKAKVITTPTAYSDGILHSVKPNVVLGNELVVNGTFDTDSDWSKTNATISGGVATVSVIGGAFSRIFQSLSYTTGRKYRINATVQGLSGSNGKQIRLIDSGSNNGGLTTSNGVITLDETLQNIEIYWVANSNSNGIFIERNTTSGDYSFTIDNVSIKEAIDADFTFTRNSSATRVNELGYIEDVQIIGGELVSNGDFEEIGIELVTNGSFDTDSDWGKVNATISDGKGNLNGTGVTSMLYQGILTNGLFYKATFTISDYNSIGNADIINASGAPYYVINSEGTFTIYFKHNDASSNFYFRARNGAIFSIDNVSVKEVGQDWIFGAGWSMGNGKAIFGDTANGDIRTQFIFTAGNKYRINLSVSDLTSGTAFFALGDGASNNLVTYDNYANGDYTFDVTAVNGAELRIYATTTSSSSFSIDNVSVKEVTDDTNLPRINYEGFTYAESLGNNLVVNGTFDTDSDWTKGTGWSVSGGKAIALNTNGNLEQFVSGVIGGKSYRITFDYVYTSGNAVLYAFGNNLGTLQETKTYSFTTTATGSTTKLQFYGVGTNLNATIDNVSVQEVIGDLPVPYSGKGHLLLEGQRTNEVVQSENFTATYWNYQQVDGTNNATLSPDGENNGTKIVANTGNYNHYFERLVWTGTASTTYTYSCFVKSAGSDYVQIATSTGFSASYQNFNLSNGTFASGDLSSYGYSSNIENYGNGWYRVSVTATSNSSGSVRFLLVPILTDAVRNPIFTGNGTDGVYTWGHQLEQGSYATSYIPTNGTAVTRLGETCNNATHSFPSEGVLYAEIAALANDGTARRLSISNGSFTERVAIGYTSSDNQIQAFTTSGGSTQSNFTSTLTDATEFNKIAIRYKENDCSMWINGELKNTDLVAVAPSGLIELAFDDGAGNVPFYGKTKMVATFPYLSNDEMECLTGQGYGTFEALAAAYSYTIK